MSNIVQLRERANPTAIDFDEIFGLPDNKVSASEMCLLCAYVLPRDDSAARRILAQAIRYCQNQHIKTLTLQDLALGSDLTDIAKIYHAYDRLEKLLDLASALNGLKKRKTTLELSEGKFRLVVRI